MKIFVLLVLLIPVCVFSQGIKAGPARNELLKEISVLYQKIHDFDNRPDSLDNGYLEDSVRKYNGLIVRRIIHAGPIVLDDSCLQDLSRIIGASFILSADKKLRVISWSVRNFYPIPWFTSLALTNKKVTIISLNGTEREDFGNNIDIYKIADVQQKEQRSYILIGSNKCASLCVQKIAALHLIAKDGLLRPVRGFKDKGNYLDKIEFDYIINDKLKKEPAFSITNATITCPVFNSDRTAEVGQKVYLIVTQKG